MKPFKVNRDSWHYKLNKYFFNSNGSNRYYMEDRWEPKHNNFCSYWRVTMLRLVFASAVTVVLSGLLFALGNVVYEYPWETLTTIATAVAMIGGLVGIIAAAITVQHLWDKRKLSKKDVPDSLFVAKYKAYKSKICPMVEYDK